MSNTLRVPSEQRRAETLLEAWQKFAQALDRRLLELQEPGREVDRAEIEEIKSLQRSLTAYAGRVVQKLGESAQAWTGGRGDPGTR